MRFVPSRSLRRRAVELYRAETGIKREMTCFSTALNKSRWKFRIPIKRLSKSIRFSAPSTAIPDRNSFHPRQDRAHKALRPVPFAGHFLGDGMIDAFLQSRPAGVARSIHNRNESGQELQHKALLTVRMRQMIAAATLKTARPQSRGTGGISSPAAWLGILAECYTCFLASRRRNGPRAKRLLVFRPTSLRLHFANPTASYY